MRDGVGRRGDGQHEGEGAGQRRRDHEVERVQPQGVGEVLEDGEEDADGGHVGGDLGGRGGALGVNSMNILNFGHEVGMNLGKVLGQIQY